MSSEPEPSLPAIGLPVIEGRNSLWGKTKEAFRYIYNNHMDDADWFLKADDDTYVIVENLRKMLMDHDADEPAYYGRRFKPYIHQGYMSGGAGYVLSKSAVKRFVEIGLTDTYKCRQDDGGAEDLELGTCMQNIGVAAGDSRDALGRETFHPFIPEHHLIPGIVPSYNWYWSYNYYPPKEVNPWINHYFRFETSLTLYIFYVACWCFIINKCDYVIRISLYIVENAMVLLEPDFYIGSVQ